MFKPCFLHFWRYQHGRKRDKFSNVLCIWNYGHYHNKLHRYFDNFTKFHFDAKKYEKNGINGR